MRTTENQNVALRKESVDRNIAITYKKQIYFVALRKESVDRNTSKRLPSSRGIRRSPQGERG